MDVARVVIGDEEDGAAEGIHLIVLQQASAERQRHGIAVVIYGSPAAAARRSRLRRVPPIADGAVIGEQAVDDGPGNADAADGPAIGAEIPEPFPSGAAS